MADWIDIVPGAQGSHQRVPRSGGLRVRLPENPTTGYRWVLLSCGTLQPVVDSFWPGAGGMGAEGMRQFDLRATSIGPQAIRLVLRREWEAGVAPLDRLELTAEVV